MTVQEDYFEFDSDFADLEFAERTAKRHPEYDSDAMVSRNGSVALVPSLYHRFRLHSLTCFQKGDMYTISMDDLIDGDHIKGMQGQDTAKPQVYVRLGLLQGYRRIVEPQAVYFPKAECVASLLVTVRALSPFLGYFGSIHVVSL